MQEVITEAEQSWCDAKTAKSWQGFRYEVEGKSRPDKRLEWSIWKFIPY